MAFFKQFPKISYDLQNNGSLITVTDIYRNVDVNDILADSNNSYFWYEIIDGDRPDIISTKLYNDVRYYWTFFIINDHLKDGALDAWPKSSGELERYLEDQYDAYSVIEFYPGTETVTSLTSATLNGIDLYYKHLRITVTSLYAASPLTAPLWVISKYDSSRYQLWINTPASYSQFKSGSDTNNSYTFVLLNEANPGSTEYIQIAATNAAWLKTYKDWAKAMFTLTVSETDTSITTASSVNFKSSATWFTGREAPITFEDNAGNNVTFYRKRKGLVAGTVSEISYATHLIEENDEKRKIRVLPASLIRDFAESYEETLND